MRRLVCLLSIGFLSLSAPLAAQDRFNLPEGPGRELIYGQCRTCHDLQSLVDSAGISRRAWNAVLDNMRGFGLRISDQQRAQILDYLATYLGPNPPPAAPVAGKPAQKVDGAQVFADQCIGCHQETGAGTQDFPPLAGNTDLFLAPDFPVLVVLHGMKGPIDVEGKHFDNEMPSFDFLSDAEIAAAINFVRSNWGNDASAPAGETVTADTVAAARTKAMTPDEVHAYRQSLKQGH